MQISIGALEQEKVAALDSDGAKSNAREKLHSLQLPPDRSAQPPLEILLRQSVPPLRRQFAGAAGVSQSTQGQRRVNAQAGPHGEKRCATNTSFSPDDPAKRSLVPVLEVYLLATHRHLHGLLDVLFDRLPAVVDVDAGRCDVDALEAAPILLQNHADEGRAFA